eukprot:CAMPEP_0114496644 /NCGR_PEP_ID=MMETSP0109-20121206/5883_1 /TAXON_ID=29199 /ORGANISM="Chlorarachnion reptans, Strain CCCM449" /LENGTH=306 /DNA_ID=CAMNT_0001673937 /DNA_START=416 /DNA_END=1336 /DNA_ORIENTATION=+
MREALTHRGYFYASNVHSLPEKYIASVYSYHEQVHNLPPTVKWGFLEPKGSYTGLDLGVENAELPYEMGTTSTVRAWDYARTQFKTNPTSYPSEEILQPGFTTFMDDLYQRQNQLGDALMVAFAEMLGLEKDVFGRHFRQGDMGTIRLLYYPGAEKQEIEKANRGISAHTDFEVFTLMHQNAPGLQFISPCDPQTWIDAPVRPAEFVVIVGDVLERFTNGQLKATPHRVLKTVHERRSIIRFNAMHPDTLVQPLPEFVSEENPPKYTPVRMKTHMKTTMDNLRNGIGAWDSETNTSLTANYVYESP